MEYTLGTFGDMRLDKGGVRSSNGWWRARRCACGVWAAIAVTILRFFRSIAVITLVVRRLPTTQAQFVDHQ